MDLLAALASNSHASAAAARPPRSRSRSRRGSPFKEALAKALLTGIDRSHRYTMFFGGMPGGGFPGMPQKREPADATNYGD